MPAATPSDPPARSRSENPLRVAHWLGSFDARPLALFRIALGAVLLQDLAARAVDFRAFLTDDGVIPRAIVAGTSGWSLFNLTGAFAPAALLYGVGALATVAFTLGYWTRIATLVTWVFFVSLHHRLPMIHTGGDTVADIMLFFGFFTELSGRWSLDARRRGIVAEVHALVPRFMTYVPAVLYLETARAKWIGGGASSWLNGPVLFEHFQLEGWVRIGGVILREHPAICAFMSGATIAVELLIPVLIVLPFWIQPARALAVVSHVGLQIGILLTLKVGIFTNVMLALTALWLQPEWLDRVGGFLARRDGTRVAPAESPLRMWARAPIAVLFALMVLDPVVPSHLPRDTEKLLSGLGLDLKIGLFTKGVPSERWEAAGVLEDRAAIDPLPVAAPRADMRSSFFNTPWMQLPYRLKQYAPLGRYVCEHYNAATHGPPLKSFTLTHFVRAPYPPEIAPPAESHEVVWNQDCSDAAVANTQLGTARGGAP